MTVRLDLEHAEADWLLRCLSLVMQLSRHWDDLRPNTPDHGNALLAKLALATMSARAAIVAEHGQDPDEWLAERMRQSD
jgi:hypothetical protein